LHTEWISEAYRVLKESSALYVFSHWSKWDILYNSVLNAGFNVKNMIVLNKSNHGAGDLFGSFSPKHELILFATKGRHELRFPEGRIDDIWNVPVKFSGSKRFHPNEKPVSWILPAILNSSDKEQVILDPFLGSGTTGIAAIGCGRQFIGVEKDQTYFDIAQKRIADAYEKSSNDLL
jgi:site-specific DNA-methyltransferase (adenine-specific)